MDIRTSYRRWASYRQTVKELSALNSRQLQDLGISRGDIAAVSRQHASLL